MTRVDFYLLGNGPTGGRDIATCRLAHKAFRLGHRIYILSADAEHAANLDRLLWTFHPGSFVPHGLNSNQTAEYPVPVLIGSADPPPEFDDVLILLTPQVPDCFSRFRRVAEIVDNDTEQKQQARERFRFYRDRGYSLQTHHMQARP